MNIILKCTDKIVSLQQKKNLMNELRMESAIDNNATEASKIPIIVSKEKENTEEERLNILTVNPRKQTVSQ